MEMPTGGVVWIIGWALFGGVFCCRFSIIYAERNFYPCSFGERGVSNERSLFRQ